MPNGWKRTEDFLSDTQLPSRDRTLTVLWEVLAVVVLIGSVWLILR